MIPLMFALAALAGCSMPGDTGARNDSRARVTPTAAASRASALPTARTESRDPTAIPATRAPAPTTQPEQAAQPAPRVEAKPEPARVVFRVSPRQATVRVDGRVVRTGAAIELEPGAHRVRATAPGHGPLTTSFALRAEQQLNRTYRLTPLPAQLTVRAPRQATVYVDGKRRGMGTRSVTIAGGSNSHRVTVRRPRHLSDVRVIRLRPGTRTTVRAHLVPYKARLRVVSAPRGATIYLDGKRVGRTPRTLRGLDPGRHALRLEKNAHRTVTRQVRLEPGRTGELRITLARKAPELAGSSAPLPHRPLAVMVENHPDARPQSGLDYADVVLEAPAEFGISRFIAFYITRDTPAIGPVRSARDYFVLWAKEFNPIYFHAGGSPGAAGTADEIGLARTNALFDGSAFYRTGDRIAPHNLYTSTDALLATRRGKPRALRSGTWGGLRFKRPGSELGPESGTYARLAFNDYYYAEWRWDPDQRVYRRWMQGEPAIERITGRQTLATAVIVRIHQMSRIAGDDKAREEVQVYGRGRAWVLQDGRMTPATWAKEDVNSPTLYYDNRGRRIAFNKGGVWIQVIPQYGAVTIR